MFDLILPIKNFETIEVEKLTYYLEILELVYGKGGVNIIISHDDVWGPECDQALRNLEKTFIPFALVKSDGKGGTSNRGKGAAIKNALRATKYPYAVFTDADFSYSVTQIIRIVDILKQNQYQAVFGTRNSVDTNYKTMGRSRISLLMRFLNTHILGLKMADTQCGIKGFSRSLFPLIENIKNDRFFFDWELVQSLEWNHVNLKTICVRPQTHSFSTAFSRETILNEFKNMFWVRRYLCIGWSLLFVFCYLMFHQSFHQNKNGIQFDVLDKVSSDFSSHLPLIRSFSLGKNENPIEYPLFSGAPIRYHYLFYWIVGKLEAAGLRLDIALNFLSALGFFLMLVAVYYLSKRLTNSGLWAKLSLLFVFSNPTLSWWYYLKSKNFSMSLAWSDLPRLNSFIGFAPWKNDNLIAAFWSLNIFLNQRHLSFAIGIWGLFILYQFWPGKLWWHSLVWGIIIGMMYEFHKSVLIMFAITLVIYFIFLPEKERRSIFLMGIVSFIVLLIQYVQHPQGGAESIGFHFGYLIDPPVTVVKFIQYWWENLGISLFTIIFGFFLLNKKEKIYFLPLFLIFIFAMSVQLTIEPAANHKFFNAYYMMGIPLTVLFWQKIVKLTIHRRYLKFLALITFLLHFPSGIVDYMPLNGQTYQSLPNLRLMGAYEYFLKTPRDSVVINNDLLYSPASLAGRKIAMGWPYFAWSMGYDLRTRIEELKRVYTYYNVKHICDYFNIIDAQYMTVIHNLDDRNAPFADVSKFKSMAKPDWQSQDGYYLIYSKKNLCSTLKR
ncbi:MAG: glycosyltransferase [Bacteriovoracaceae bacterium]|nr:glycosyltransferase [Bacteriovoracaceae bacterium]